ncbi:pilus assembly PilX family protein [Comamonas composti]|uniref:pilus assembly PilX family protein n=1 Tax=Comamonas composti TaxID=408558 RepID=UPI00047DE904|nr:PilX N-terminal domain-containing pilus assembly protein [Comamonas composti]
MSQKFHMRSKAPLQQRGVALFVVIVFVMLSMLLALWASRTSLFNELVVSNDADYQRAFEAAQALLQDAELDIRNENSDGSTCATPTSTEGKELLCRPGNIDKVPLEAQAILPLLTALDAQPSKCRYALCSKRASEQDFWNDKDTLKEMTKSNVGARYGDYTGAAPGTPEEPANPILADRGEKSGGWYWIEVLPYDESSKNSGLFVDNQSKLLGLNLTPNVIYRITALAYGRKAETMVVLQQTYAQQKLKD